MTSRRLPGVLLIGKSATCPVCEDLEKKGFFSMLQDLQDEGFISEVAIMQVNGDTTGTATILVIDQKYPNFKYFASKEVFEDAKVSGRDWKRFLPQVRFFNRKIIGDRVEMSPDYVGGWSVDIFKRFCLDSKLQIDQVAQVPSGLPPKIVPRYPNSTS